MIFVSFLCHNAENSRNSSAAMRTSCIVLAFLGLALSSHAVWYVDINSPTPSGDGTSWATAFRSIQAGIEAAGAAGGGEVWVAAGIYHETISLASHVALYAGFIGGEVNRDERNYISNQTVIDGQTLLISGEAQHVVSMVDVEHTVLDGLEITSKHALAQPLLPNVSGAGIYCVNSDDTNIVANCTITENTARNGGGMQCLNASPLVLKSKFIQNSALDTRGGAVDIQDQASPVFLDCVFVKNEAVRDGGAVYAEYQATARFERCWFEENNGGIQGFGLGGAVFLGNQTSIINSVFWKNSAEEKGGAIYLYNDGPAEVLNCTFVGNRAPEGGGINLSGTGETKIYNVIFKGNSDFAIYNNRPPEEAFPGAKISLIANLFFENTEGDYFSAHTGPVRDAIVINTFIAGAIDNYTGDPLFAQEEAGDFKLLDESSAVDRGSFDAFPLNDIDDRPRPGTDGKIDIGAYEAPDQFNPPLGTRSAIFPLPFAVAHEIVEIEWDSEGIVDYVRLYYRRNGGPWLQYSGQFTSSPINFDTTLTGGDGYYEVMVIATNTAGNHEPLIFDAEQGVEVNVHGMEPRIYVHPEAGGVGSGGSWANALHSIQPAIDLAAKRNIGEVWVRGGNYYETIRLQGPVALYGGFAGHESSLNERMLMANPTTIDASAVREGAPANNVVTIIALWESTDSERNDVILDGFIITGGHAGGAGNGRDQGGGIYIASQGQNVRISNCAIRDNRALDGAGIYVDSGSPIIEDCVITNNQALRYGGGIQFGVPPNSFVGGRQTPILAKSTVSSNEAGYGGGVSVNNMVPMITDCSFVDNVSTNSGGGLLLFYSRSREAPTISRTVFFRNRSNVGGGTYFAGFPYPSGVAAVFDSCRYAYNEAVSGGGLAAVTDSLNVSNTVFYNNRGSYGGAVSVEGVQEDYGVMQQISTPVFVNCTLSHNVASMEGESVYVRLGLPIFTNTIFGGREKASIYSIESRTRLFHNLFEENPHGLLVVDDEDVFLDVDTINSALEDTDGNIQGDPAFVNPARENFRLLPGSVAIDAGTMDGAPPTDINGIARPQGPGIDIGAFEYSEDTGEGEGEGEGGVEGEGEGGGPSCLASGSRSGVRSNVADAFLTFAVLFLGARRQRWAQVDSGPVP